MEEQSIEDSFVGRDDSEGRALKSSSLSWGGTSMKSSGRALAFGWADAGRDADTTQTLKAKGAATD